jgi:phosphoglycolate phosphatase
VPDEQISKQTKAALKESGSSMLKSQYRHIIWDWNGTLFNDAWLSVEIMNGLLRARNMPAITLQRYAESFDFPVIGYYQRLGFNLDTEPFEKVGTEFIVGYEKRKRECVLQSGAEDILKKISVTRISQSILSAYKQDTLDELLIHFDLWRFFIRAIGLDDHYAAGKMENGILLMSQLPYEPHEVLFIGDTVHDYDVSREMGTNCILIPSGHQPREKLESCGVPVLGSISDIPRFLF